MMDFQPPNNGHKEQQHVCKDSLCGTETEQYYKLVAMCFIITSSYGKLKVPLQICQLNIFQPEWCQTCTATYGGSK